MWFSDLMINTFHDDWEVLGFDSSITFLVLHFWAILFRRRLYPRELNLGKDLKFCPGIRKPNLNALPDFQGLDYQLVKNWQVGYEFECHTILCPWILIMRTRLKIGINVRWFCDNHPTLIRTFKNHFILRFWLKNLWG